MGLFDDIQDKSCRMIWSDDKCDQVEKCRDWFQGTSPKTVHRRKRCIQEARTGKKFSSKQDFLEKMKFIAGTKDGGGDQSNGGSSGPSGGGGGNTAAQQKEQEEKGDLLGNPWLWVGVAVVVIIIILVIMYA